MNKYVGTFADILSDCGIKPEEWDLFVESARVQRKEHPEPVLTEKDHEAIKTLFKSFEEDVDVENLTSRHYDPDPYGIGGQYSCADNWSYDEEELTWETLKIFLDRIFSDQLYNYIDLSAPELEDEEILACAASLEAIGFVWGYFYNHDGKNPLF